MSNTPGIYPSVTNLLVSTQAVPTKAIGLVGHRDLADPNASSTIRPYSATTRGEIYTYTSFSDWLSLLGTITTPDFVNGVEDDGVSTAAITPHSPKNNLLYSLALIYAAAPSAKVRVAVIDGNSNGITANNTTAVTAGTSSALSDLLVYNDIGAVVISNIDPVTDGKSHVETAANQLTYNSPRFYVTGIDLFKAWDGVTYSGAGSPLDASNDLSAWSGVQSDYGLVISHVGNYKYNFASIGDNTTRQIGGQLYAAFLAGLIVNNPDNYTMTNSANGLGETVFVDSSGNTVKYIFSETEVEEAINGGWTISKFDGTAYVLAKGITYASSAGSSWQIFTIRAVTNYVQKVLATNLRQFVGKLQTASSLSSAQKMAEGLMSEAVIKNYITDFSIKVSSHSTELDAIVVQAEFTPIRPINKIYLNMQVS
jgi:hypothetical protein